MGSRERNQVLGRLGAVLFGTVGLLSGQFSAEQVARRTQW